MVNNILPEKGNAQDFLSLSIGFQAIYHELRPLTSHESTVNAHVFVDLFLARDKKKKRNNLSMQNLKKLDEM